MTTPTLDFTVGLYALNYFKSEIQIILLQNCFSQSKKKLIFQSISKVLYKG